MNNLYKMKEGLLNKKGLLLERRTFKNVEAFKKVFDKLLSETNIEIKKEIIQKTADTNEKYIIVTYDLGSIDKKVLRIFFQIINEKTQEIEVDFIELSNQPSRKANTYFIYELTSASVTSNTELKNMIKAIAHICSYYNKKSDLKNITSSASVFKKYKINVDVRKRNNFDIAKFRGGNKIIIDYNSDIPLGTTANAQDSSDPILIHKKDKQEKGLELTPKEIQKIDKEIPIQGKIEIDKKTVKRGRKKKEKPEEQPVIQQGVITTVIDGKKSPNKIEFQKVLGQEYIVSEYNIKELPKSFYKTYGKPIFYENGDTNKPINIPSKEEADAKIKSLNREETITPNISSSKVPMLQNPKFYCTDQQLAVRNTKESVIVNAYAGAGKTTTIIEYCLANPNEKKLYLVYNIALRKEMQKKVENLNIKNLTIMGTMQLMNRYYIYRKGLSPNLIEDADLKLNPIKRNSKGEIIYQPTYSNVVIDYDSFDYINEEMKSFIKPRLHTKLMVNIYNNFCTNDEPNILNYKPEYDLTDERDIEFVMKNKEKILEFQKKLYDAMSERYNKKITWNFMSKYASLYAIRDVNFLSKDYDCMLLDEGQDTANSIFIFINAQENIKKIIVGDSHQNIYGFLNTQNALSKFNYKILELSSSRRFTQEIANYAMGILDQKIRVGLDTSNIQIYADAKPTDDINSHAYIGKVNNTLLKYCFKSLISDSESNSNISLFFEGSKDKDESKSNESKKYVKEAFTEDNRSGFEKIFLKAYDNIITADILYVFYTSYLNKKTEYLESNPSAWNQNFDWSDFNNKNFYDDPFFSSKPESIIEAIKNRLLWCPTKGALYKYAVNKGLSQLIRLLKLFNDKVVSDLSREKFLSIIDTCIKLEEPNKLKFEKSIELNKDIDHRLYTTIHKSKGLEYDAVTFLPDMVLPKPPFEYKTNSKGFVLLNPITKLPEPEDPIRFNKKRQNYIEEINKVYVAATRAKQKIFGGISLESKEEEGDTIDASSYNYSEQLMYYNKRYV